MVAWYQTSLIQEYYSKCDAWLSMRAILLSFLAGSLFGSFISPMASITSFCSFEVFVISPDIQLRDFFIPLTPLLLIAKSFNAAPDHNNISSTAIKTQSDDTSTVISKLNTLSTNLNLYWFNGLVKMGHKFTGYSGKERLKRLVIFIFKLKHSHVLLVSEYFFNLFTVVGKNLKLFLYEYNIL